MRSSNRKQKPGRSSGSIDGFVSNNRQLGQPHDRSKPQTTPSLDQFIRRADGFHSARQVSGGIKDTPEAKETESLLDEPIELDLDKLPQSRHSRRRKQRRLSAFFTGHPRTSTLLKRGGLAIIVAALIGIGYLGYKFYNTQKQVLAGGGQAPAVCGEAGTKISDLQSEGDGRVNTLLLGIGGPGHDGPNLTDTIILASLDPINNKLELVSLPRDLWVKIPGDGYQKINAAYPYGVEQAGSTSNSAKVQAGIRQLDETIAPVLGLPIHYHVVLDFAAFKDIVNDLGGVTVNVPETLYDPTIAWENSWNPVIARQGKQKFDGQTALLYARSRETSSDFARGERQRLLITAVKDKALSAGTFSNPIKIVELLNSLGKNVYTDFNSASLKCLYKRLSLIPSSSIVSLDLVKPPHDLLTTGTINGLSVVEPKAGLFDYSAIQSFLHTALRDGFIARENSGIAVYNATNIDGLAGREGTVLQSLGYSVTTVANAPNPNSPARTVVVDLTDGKDKYTRHYLEERFNVSALGDIPTNAGITPPASTDFVIILGRNAANNT